MSAAPTQADAGSFIDRIDRPIFIVSSPRSGSTLLFETLAQAPALFTIGGESHRAIESIPAFSVPGRGWSSNRLVAEDAAPEASELLAQSFYGALRDRDGRPPQGAARMLEKTPKNALRVPFFNAVWPDAEFVFLYRDARPTIASMIEAWRSGGFRTYPRLPGWTGPPWSLLLVPGWQRLNGLPLHEIAARQWATTLDLLLDDLAALPHSKVRTIRYDRFLAAPQQEMKGLASSLDLQWDRQLGDDLPLSQFTVSRPAAEKWRAMEGAIEEIWPLVEKTDARARAFADALAI